MKKILLIPALLAGSMAFSKTYDYEITPMIGYNYNKNIDLQNHPLFGFEAQFNSMSKSFSPELSLFYAKGEYATTKSEPTMFRAALNLVFENHDSESVTPFAKIGGGYRKIGIFEDGSHNTHFLDAGAGLKIALSKKVSLKVEALYMNDYNSARWVHNASVLGGLSFAFGKKSKDNSSQEEKIEQKKSANFIDNDNDGVEDSYDKCTKTPKGEAVDSLGCRVDGDADNDGIKDSIDKCVNTPKDALTDRNGCEIDGDFDKDGVKDSIDKCVFTKPDTKVYSNGCTVDLDSDLDGVKDSIDECADTPADSIVTTNGCAKNEANYKTASNLNVTFEYKSYNITENSRQNVMVLKEFLQNNPSYDVQILGYTDSIAEPAYNRALSQKRANAIKEILVKSGIAASRIEAIGKGEVDPIASNVLEEGRAKNRRIEVELIKK